MHERGVSITGSWLTLGWGRGGLPDYRTSTARTFVGTGNSVGSMHGIGRGSPALAAHLVGSLHREPSQRVAEDAAPSTRWMLARRADREAGIATTS